MCFNKETSLSVFCIGLLSSFYLFNRNKKYDRVNSILVFLISLIQLIEYFLWLYPDCDKKNQIVSIFIMITLFIQPTLYFIYIYSTQSMSEISKIVGFACVCFTSVVFAWILYVIIPNKKDICSQVEDHSCRLTWGPLKYLYQQHLILFILGCISYLSLFYIATTVLTKYPSPFIQQYFIRICLIISIVVSIIIDRKQFANIFGSLWCFISLFYGIICILS